jgi:septum formation protein
MLPSIVLASQSPRRREILANAGIPFTVRAQTVAEVRTPGESPEAYVRRLARAKAEAAREQSGEIVLGADTVVILDGEVLEKPAHAAGARAMLERLAGREHTVVTGICLLHSGAPIIANETTRVRFAALDASEIEDYASSGEPLDKAGAYAIQGLASKFVERIDGCYFNVMGLPVALVYRHLKEIAGRRPGVAPTSP